MEDIMRKGEVTVVYLPDQADLRYVSASLTQ
jgi:hypothetical protein